jgi:hypothetical protein
MFPHKKEALMGSPLAQNQDVQEIVKAIGNRDVEWLESLHGQTKPSPSHLMYACASVLGDGGQDHIADMMKKVPGRARRAKFIDLAIQLAKAEDAEPQEVAEVVEAEAPAPEPENKKRRRRTKAEMAAARAEEAGEDIRQVAIDEATGSSDGDLMEALKEVQKSLFSLDERINALSEAVIEISKARALNNKFIEEWVVEPNQNLGARAYTNSIKLDVIKDALVAAELDLVMAGQLSAAAISDTIEASWPTAVIGDEPPF